MATQGFVMAQPEVFVAAVATRRVAEHVLESLQSHAPTTGSVCALVLTERQFVSMRYLVGEPSYQERAVGSTANVSL